MHIRTIYFKVADLAAARAFWTAFLETDPHKDFEGWCEFMVGDTRLALLPLDGTRSDSNCVPVFELPGGEQVRARANLALSLGATRYFEAPDDPDATSIVLVDVSGNQFELTDFHD